jgi:hypothetical protein
MKSLPFTPRTLVASEARLERVYEAARTGLRGDSLALAANLLPVEYERLKALDPIVEMAELKGRADMEAEMAQAIIAGARAGDLKAAQFLLTHRADWVARQQISVDVNQQISITQALEQATQRVMTIDMERSWPEKQNAQ